MSKIPNKRTKPARRDEPMNGAMKFFLAGCVAELYLLLIRRFYVNADSDLQRITWYDSYLWVLVGVGAAVLVAGVVCAFLWRGNPKFRIGCLVIGAGFYISAVAGLVRWNMSFMTLLMVVVPVVMLLGILWSLYDRECALSLTILGVTLIALWVCRRALSSVVVGLYVKIAAIIYLALLVILLVQVARKKLDKLLPAKADPCRYMLPAVSPLPPWSLFYSVPRLPIMSCGPLQLSCLAWRFIIRSSSCKMSFYAHPFQSERMRFHLAAAMFRLGYLCRICP